MSGNNKNLVLGPRWGLTPRLTDRLTVGRNVTLTLITELVGELESGETVNYGMRPVGLETKNDRAGESQQQFIRPTRCELLQQLEAC
jgi:hypothetical protein